MPVDPVFERFAVRLAAAVREHPDTLDRDLAELVAALGARTLKGQGAAHGISAADLPGLTQVGVAVGQAALASDMPDLAAIERLATSESPAVRCCAAMALGEYGTVHPKQIVPAAYRLAKDAAWEVREFIANALDERMGQTQGDFVYQLMRQWVGDLDENVRRVPTNALMRYGRRHPDRVLALMGELRHDTSAYVRKNVAFCLGVLGLERHPILGHPDAANPGRVFAVLREWVEEQDEGTRWIVADTLSRAWSKSDPDETLRLLRRLAADPRKTVRSGILSALKAIGKRDPSTAAQLREWLQDDDPLVREMAQRAGATAG
jgi:HEAT repeat protein